nr:site-specific integrase [Microbacterium karelineae]
MDLLAAQRDTERTPAREVRARPQRDLRSEIDQVFAVIPHHADRDHLLFGLLAHLGLRPGEALALAVDDFQEATASLFVTGWGGKRRRVLVDDRQVLLRLENYVRFAASSSGPLFTAVGRSTPLRYQSVQHRWAQYCARAGIDVKLSDLRRAHVADLVAGGVPESVIRERIGQAAGVLDPGSILLSREESDAEMRAWQERSAAGSRITGMSNARERHVG